MCWDGLFAFPASGDERVSLSPRAGRGWGEGALPPDWTAEQHPDCSESRRGPLTLASHSRCFASAFLALGTASAGRLCSPRTRGEVILIEQLLLDLHPAVDVVGRRGGRDEIGRKAAAFGLHLGCLRRH